MAGATPLPGARAGAEEDVRFYLEERYAHRPRSALSLTLYYRLKPLIPRRVQLAMRRRYARRLRRRHQAGQGFPRWPIEPLLVERERRALQARAQRAQGEPVPLVEHWPQGHRFAYVLTHDVEGPRGLAQIPALLEIERRHGMVSAWYVVGQEYPVDLAVLDLLRSAGCEVGLHGLRHDGRLFEDRAAFERQVPEIRKQLARWGADGFRSPALHRNAAWMPELGCAYDSSFPDTDPYEPQPGGCCSIVPYFLGDLVELPLTLVQDHTLFEILGETDIALWREKAAWVAQHGGLVNVLVHPDYALTEERLRHYDDLLTFLEGLEDGWHALPRDVAAWWRERATIEQALQRGHAAEDVVGAGGRASVAWAREAGGTVVVERERAA